MSKIDVPEVLDVLRQVAAERPDHVDERSTVCGAVVPRYVVHGEPQCLVAVVLVRLGISPRAVAQLDRQRRSGEASIRFAYSDQPIARRFTRSARALLDRVQALQDGGWSWGQTVQQVTYPGYRNHAWLEAL